MDPAQRDIHDGASDQDGRADRAPPPLGTAPKSHDDQDGRAGRAPPPLGTAPKGRDGAGGEDGRGGLLRAGAGLGGVLVGLVVVLWLLGLTDDDSGLGGDGRSPEAAEPAEAPTTSSPVRDTAQQPGAAADSGAASPEEPFSALEGRLAYLSGAEVAVVELATGVVTRVPIEVSGSIIPLPDFELLNDGKRTVAVSLRTDPPRAVLVTSLAVVVPAAEPLVEYWVINRPAGPNGVILLAAWQAYGYMSSYVVAPAGSQLLRTGEAGLLVVPPVGRTFRPTLTGFEAVSEHRLLAANDHVRVEQRCDAQLVCSVVAVDTGTEQATELPPRFVAELAEITVSARGRWVLNDTSPARLLDRSTQQFRLLEVGGFGRAQWSYNPTSVAWLTTDRTPTLVTASVAPADGEQGWAVVELSGLGADPSPGSSFLLD